MGNLIIDFTFKLKKYSRISAFKIYRTVSFIHKCSYWMKTRMPVIYRNSFNWLESKIDRIIHSIWKKIIFFCIGEIISPRSSYFNYVKNKTLDREYCIKRRHSVNITGRIIMQCAFSYPSQLKRPFHLKPARILGSRAQAHQDERKDDYKRFHIGTSKQKAPGLSYRPQGIKLSRCNSSGLNILQTMTEIKGVCCG